MRTVVSGIVALLALMAGVRGDARPSGSAPRTIEGQRLPNGERLTPTAAPGSTFMALNPGLPDLPGFTAGQASATALSPDGTTLLVLTSGYNRNYGADGKPIAAQSNEYVFVYDVRGAVTVQRQALTIANAFEGLAWAPDGHAFYVSAGVDDAVAEFVQSGDQKGFTPGRRFALGHAAGLGMGVKPMVAQVSVSPDGARLLAANYYNDSVSLIDLAAGKVIAEQDLRPGKASAADVGKAGGTYPRGIAWAGPGRAFVSSQRDREVIALDMAAAMTIAGRTSVRGQPGQLVGRGGRVFAALDNSDGVAVLDAVSGIISDTIPALPAALAPRGPKLGGVGVNALALSADGATLYASEGGLNAVAVVALGQRAGGRVQGPSRVTGLIPTGWYPTGVAVRADGRLYAVNGKSVPGPNSQACRDTLSASDAPQPCQLAQQYVWQMEKAGLLSVPALRRVALATATAQVARNDGLGRAGRADDIATMAFVHAHVRHVIYIVKENRTYDQVLGDLEVGDGDKRLALFPEATTPNQHALARQFVTMDSFMDAGESSNTGWTWSTAARTTDLTEREAPVNYARRGLSYDQEGLNRNVNVSFGTAARRHAANPADPGDADTLAGTADVNAPDGPDEEAGEGYLWNAALRAHFSLRNYGWFGDLSRYFGKANPIPPERDAFGRGLRVFIPAKAALASVSDPYYRGFDLNLADFYREREWAREFASYEARGDLPRLTLIRLPNDHMGSFATAQDGVNTPETQVADNDYALGKLIETVARSRYARDTLIFVVEDDAQNGADHIDAHRSTAFVVGPYVRAHALVSAPYDTVSMLRTIEMVLGLPPMNLLDRAARPMAAVFDRQGSAAWSFTARVPAVLRTTALPLPPATVAEAARSTHDGAWWAAATAGQNFREPDHLDTAAFNAALTRGLKR